MATEGLAHRFAYHPPKDDSVAGMHGQVRESCLTLAAFLDDHLPEGREKALVFTKLEEAMFWSNASIARNQE